MSTYKLESKFKSDIHESIKAMLPGCLILSNDAGAQQGIPDTLVLFGERWATLEFKRSAKASKQPNQDYWVDLMNAMSFSAFIYPENAEEVLYALQQSFSTRR